ncbi:hypothetical protein, partial [Mycobacterium sp. 1164966.3]|uniref:hypothetical protein n=1 Tax=Mycobacterium sp. 1164966.3 TaxID=1856861 RepID=UPI00352EFD89
MAATKARAVPRRRRQQLRRRPASHRLPRQAPAVPPAVADLEAVAAASRVARPAGADPAAEAAAFPVDPVEAGDPAAEAAALQ